MPNEWQTVLDYIAGELSELAYATYFKNFGLIAHQDDAIKISVPNSFVKSTVEKKYMAILKDALASAGLPNKDIEFVIQSETKKKPVVRRAVEILPGSEQSAAMGTPTNYFMPNRTQTNPSPFARSVSAPLASGLNKAYRLENYIVGSNNDLAVSAARAIIDNPGKVYNPLFIYGGPGLGKTHLIQAIGNEIKEKNPEMNVVYVTIETFYREFVAAMKQHVDNFSDKYRKTDVLIVDDFQFIQNKNKSQEEFFHTFNELHEHGKQVIVSSDRLPSEIATVDTRLASRLMMGMAIDIQLPDFETRCAIVAAKAELRGETLSDKAIETIARSVDTNIRELEGQLNRVLLFAEMRGVSPDVILEGDTVATPQSATTRRALTAKQVIEKVAKYYDLSAKDLYGKSRTQNIKDARQVAMYLLSRQLELSTVKIGTELGKDHTTVMHGINMVEEKMKTNFNLRNEINELRTKLYGN